MHETPEPAPTSWLNYRRFRQGTEPIGANEITLYSDAHPPGTITAHDLGPYSFFPTGHGSQSLTQAIVVRATHHIEQSEWDVQNLKTHIGAFHGGSEADEIAALLALSLDVRMESGGITREWWRDETPLGGPGSPILWQDPPNRARHARRLLRCEDRQIDLESALPLLRRFFESSADEGTAIMRAARLYQKALWVSDSDPNQAFLWLVAALEAAAVQHRGSMLTPTEALKEGIPSLYKLVSHDPSLCDQTAAAVADLTKATNRFISFAIEFGPPAPPNRPPQYSQVDWTKLKRHLGTIYGYRSAALHSGVPFPTPMCMPPRPNEDAERPMANGYKANGAEWKAKDLPMYLHTFCYIVRGTLMRWISSLQQIDGRSSDPKL